jgi:hypothetical protein
MAARIGRSRASTQASMTRSECGRSSATRRRPTPGPARLVPDPRAWRMAAGGDRGPPRDRLLPARADQRPADPAALRGHPGRDLRPAGRPAGAVAPAPLAGRTAGRPAGHRGRLADRVECGRRAPRPRPRDPGAGHGRAERGRVARRDRRAGHRAGPQDPGQAGRDAGERAAERAELGHRADRGDRHRPVHPAVPDEGLAPDRRGDLEVGRRGAGTPARGRPPDRVRHRPSRSGATPLASPSSG